MHGQQNVKITIPSRNGSLHIVIKTKNIRELLRDSPFITLRDTKLGFDKSYTILE